MSERKTKTPCHQRSRSPRSRRPRPPCTLLRVSNHRQRRRIVRSVRARATDVRGGSETRERVSSRGYPWPEVSLAREVCGLSSRGTSRDSRDLCAAPVPRPRPAPARASSFLPSSPSLPHDRLHCLLTLSRAPLSLSFAFFTFFQVRRRSGPRERPRRR